MFKLKKIINSGVNVPEPERCYVSLTKDVKAGTLLLESEGILGIGNATMTPTHITISDIKKGGGYALCYRISPEMIFEIETRSYEIAMVSRGCRLSLIDDGSGFNAISDNIIEEGGALVYDTNGAAVYGDTMYVTFK